jgi:hypothetical protein
VANITFVAVNVFCTDIRSDFVIIERVLLLMNFSSSLKNFDIDRLILAFIGSILVHGPCSRWSTGSVFLDYIFIDSFNGLISCVLGK